MSQKRRREEPATVEQRSLGREPDGGTAVNPVIDRAELADLTAESAGTVGGVLLAAGPGERYEGPYKLLEEVEGEPIVRRAARTLLESELADVVVVVGHESDAVRDALQGLDVEILENTNYRRGQSTSLHLGVEMARERGWDAIVFGLGDMPFVTRDVVDLLLSAYAGEYGSIIAAGFEGKRGNPTLFDKRYYDDLLEVSGDTGGRPVLMSSSDVAIVETGEPGVLRDIDTREEFDTYT